MASKVVMDAVSARIGGTWNGYPVFDPNTVGDPPADGSRFLAIQYPVANENQITVGSPGANVFREDGAIRFVYSIPRGVGVGDDIGLLDGLRALFRGKQFAFVTTYAPSSAVLDDSNDNGNYWKLSFAVPYYFDLAG